MEALGLQSAGNVLFGKSLLTDLPFSVQTLPEAMPTVVAPADTYVGANASVAADHESLKTPGTASHAAVTPLYIMRCGGIQKVSRPISRCHWMSQVRPHAPSSLPVSSTHKATR